MLRCNVPSRLSVVGSGSASLEDVWIPELHVFGVGVPSIHRARKYDPSMKHGDARGDSWLVRARHYWSARVFDVSPVVRSVVANAGDIASAGQAASGLSSSRPELFADRTLLWSKILASAGPSSPLTVLEFGVGDGAASRWWLSRLKSPDCRWTGFDVFTGNPHAWREHEAGIWSTNGAPPELADARVEWIVGDVLQTSSEIESRIPTQPSPLLVLLDLNLAAPTDAVADVLSRSVVREGFVYFDDFYDPDQRRIALRLWRDLGGQEVIGRTAKSLAYRFSTTSRVK